MEIQYLKDDLSEIIEAFEPTEAQEKKYPTGLSREMLGCDHANPLRLLVEDGGDGENVCAMEMADVACVWKYEISHVFPSSRDLVRLAVFFHLEFYHALALVLKGGWEKFFSVRTGWPKNEIPLDELMLDREAIKQYKTEFFPDSDDLFKLFEEHGSQASEAGYDRKRFASLIQEIILNDLHISSIRDNDELKTFAAAKILEYNLVSQSEEKLQVEFWLKKCKWLEMQGALEEQLMFLEKRRLQNANVTHQWLNTFGEDYVDLEEQIWRLRMLERRIQILENSPEISEEELDRKVMELEREEQKRLEELRYQLALAPWLQHPTASGTIGEQELLDYQQKCKEVLRKLWMLLYPDRLERHPAYHKLTEQQRHLLRELWEKIPEIKPDELGYQANQVGYWTRSLQKLMEALATAENILANAGLNINISLQIQGDSLEEKIDWLTGEVKNLERDIQSVKAEIRALNKDKDILEKHNILSYPEKYDETKGKIKERANEYRKQAEQLQTILAQLLARQKSEENK